MHNFVKIIILSVVCVAHCAAILGDLPANARLDTEHDSRGRLTEINIDYNRPTPTLRNAALADPTFEYEHDNQGRLTEIDIDYNERTHYNTKAVVETQVVQYSASTLTESSPVPTIPVVHSPVFKAVVPENPIPVATVETIRVREIPEHSTIFKAVVPGNPAPVTPVDTASAPIVIQGPKVVLRQAPGQKAPQVIIKGPEVVYELPAAPGAPVALAPTAPTATAEIYTTHVATVDTASSPIVIQGPQVVFRQAPGPKAPQVIIKGPEVVYELPAAPGAPAVLAPIAPTAAVEMYTAPAPVPSPLIKMFYTIEDGEVEEVFQGNMQTVNNLQFLNMVSEVDNLTPVTYSIPATSMTQRFHYKDNESDEVFDDSKETVENHPIIYNNPDFDIMTPITYNNPDLDILTPIMYNAPATSLTNFPTRIFSVDYDESNESTESFENFK